MFEGSGASLFSSDYMPHGMCYGWEPSILWTSIAADLLIAASYFSIPFAILWFQRRKQVTKFRNVFLLFSAFIFLCGLSHVFGIVTIFKGIYGYQAMIKMATAIVSFITAIAVFYYLPIALKIPSQGELASAQQDLNDARIYKSLCEFSPIGLMLVDKTFNIRLVNKKLCNLFDYQEHELIGQSVNILVGDAIKDIHINYMAGYLNDPTDRYPMNMGRVVHGVTKSGKKIPIEISLSTNHLDGDVQIYASIVDVTDKKQTNEMLHQALARLERITDATEDGLWEWNIVNNETWQSRQHLQKIGLTDQVKPSFSGWEQHIHPEHKARVLDKLNESINNHEDLFVEYLGKGSSGAYEWFRSRGKVMYSKDGQPLLMAGSLVNIQSLKINEIELLNKTNYLEKVLNRSINGLYIYNFSREVNTYINDEYERITGYTLKDLEAIKDQGTFLELFHPDELQDVLAHMGRVMQQLDGCIEPMQYRFKHKDGHWVWCMSHDSVFSLNDDGTPKEMLGTFIDMSAIKEAEINQKKLMKDFKNTFELAAVGVAHVSLNGKWIKVNKKVCDILGYQEKELLNIDFQTITHKDDLYIDLENVKKLLNGEDEFYTMEKRYVHKNGSIIWAMLTVSLVRHEDASPDYFISVIEDIQSRKLIESERLALNLELKKSNDQLSRFAYSASHDMQEPLRKITAFSTSLLSRLEDKHLDEKSKFELSRISSSAIRMKIMIQRLLELSRSSQTQLHCTQVDFHVLVGEAKDALALMLDETHTAVHELNNGYVYCDHDVMNSVMQNLFKNAIKYRHADRIPVIEVSFESHEKYNLIRIKDNGMGFDNRYSDVIFEPFKRLVSHQTIEGAGMGLAICRQLIELHNGSLTADGCVGEGATFEISLPKEMA